jgi:glycosyltransferase involved in cell wall biosynthesis
MVLTHSRENPASRFRIGQYIPYLERLGWRVLLRPQRPAQPRESRYPIPALRPAHRNLRLAARRINRMRDVLSASGFDAVFLNRDALEGNLRYEKWLLHQNPCLVFDFDDAIYLDGKETHFGWVCSRAAWVTAGNESLAAFARRFSDRVTVLPTAVEADRYVLKGHGEPSRPFRLGWCGSNLSIRQTLFPHLPMLARLQDRLGFVLVIMSKPRPLLPDAGIRWEFMEWSEEAETRMAAHFDAGIMPLLDEEYQRHKCGCKLLQYMAAGLPAVASPVGVNINLADCGRRILLAGNEEEWYRSLERLMTCGDLRRELGRRGRDFVEKEYSLKRWLPVLVDVLDKALAARRARRLEKGRP